MSSNAWLPLAVAIVAAFAAVGSALISARSAGSVKRAELQAHRIQTLESRVSERKYEVYRPMIDMLSKLTDSRSRSSVIADQESFLDEIAKFSAWIPIYGSDASVVAFHNYMQAVFHTPPTAILMRLYADFVLEARRDMGYPETEVKLAHLLGMRINDVYEHELGHQLQVPFEGLCILSGWTPPWAA